MPVRSTGQFSFTQNIGVAALTRGKVCLSIRNRGLPGGSRIRLIQTSPPQIVSDARVLRADESCPSIDPAGVDISRYEIRLAQQENLSGLPAIALYGVDASFGKADDLVVSDLDGDGKQEYFRSCASSEGIHFTVWSGKPLQGKLRWRQYLYLGYDVEATCTPTEIEGPK